MFQDPKAKGGGWFGGGGGLFGNLTPAKLGLLNAAATLMQSSGPSTMPVSTGQAFSRALQSGLLGYQQAQTFQNANELRTAQLAEAKRKAEEHARQRMMEDALLNELGFNPFASTQTPDAPQGTPQETTPDTSRATSRGLFGTTDFATKAAPDGLMDPKGGGLLPPGLNRQAVLMSLVPSLAPLGKMAHDATKPTDKMRELISRGVKPGSPQWNAELGTHFNQGGAWQVGPDGQLRLAPNYAEGMGAVKGAEAGAAAGFDLVDVPIPGGGTQRMTRAEAVRRLSGAPQPSSVPVTGGPSQGSQSSPLPGKATQGLGYTRPAAEAAADLEFQKTVAGEFAKNYADLQRADFNAPANISKYTRLKSLLGDVKTGKFTTTTTQIKAAAKAAGIDLGALGVTDDVPQAQAAMALSNQLAIELRNPAGGAGMPGALSDKDREFLVAMVPGLENDPAAIPLMVEYRLRLAQREQQVARMARAYKKKRGRFDEGFYDELADWSNKNPLFKDSDRKAVAPGKPKFLGFE